MRTVKALYKISRPLSTLTGIITVLLGGYVAQTGAWGDVLLAALATLFIATSANAWNDSLDVEADKVNQPHRPIPSGMISAKEARGFSFWLAMASLGVALFINSIAFAVVLSCNILLYLYSWRLKSTVLMGNAVVALISGATAVFGGIAAGNVLPSLWLALIVATAIMGREVLKTLADYEGDLHQRYHTVATVWGRKVAKWIFIFLLATFLGMVLLPSVLRVYNTTYLFVVSVGVLPVAMYVIIRVMGEESGRQLEQLSQLMKYDFMIWFLAVLLGTIH